MRLIRIAVALLLVLIHVPAMAGVTITFWSHDQDQEFPHTFFTLEGTPDAGGPALDENHGFTAKAITPAILWGTVGGKVESVKSGYMKRSDAQFSVVLTDTQLADVQALVREWHADSKYNLNKRNCIHFVAEAMRRSGVTVPDLPELMKKPRSFVTAVGQANEGRVTQVKLDGGAYLARRETAPVPASVAIVPVAPVR